jgi:hypothetical protein
LKKILVALALVILIVSSASLLSAPNVKADPSEARILSYSWYVAPSTSIQAQYAGDLIVVGEVQNVGTNTLGNVVVGAEAYNASGGFVGSSQSSAYVTYLAPGQKAPFYLDFIPDVTDITLYNPNWASLVTNVTIRVLNAADSSQTQYSGLTVPAGSVSNSTSTGTYTITGTVQNTGNQATGRVWLISTFYNASGTVIGLNYTNYISQSLLPGRSATFTASPIDNTAQLSSSITSYSSLVQSDPTPIATSTPTTPITTPTIQPSTSPTSSGQPTPTASSGVPLSLITDAAIIAVVIVLIILVAFMFLRRRQRNAEFDLPPPPPPE